MIVSDKTMMRIKLAILFSFLLLFCIVVLLHHLLIYDSLITFYFVIDFLVVPKR